MLFFDKHPIFKYQFVGRTYEFIDIFRKNNITIDSRLLSNYLLETNDTIEAISKKIYNDETYSWLLSLNSNITSRNTAPSLSQDITISNKKVYSIVDVEFDIKFGDIVINAADFDDFSAAEDPFLYVTSWDPLFRSIVVTEKLTEGNSFAEDDTLFILRKDTINNTYIHVTAPNGVALKKLTSIEKFPISFSLNNNTISPYLNVSGSGNTYMSQVSTGVDFAKTLLYSYITDGISHDAYDTKTEESKFKIFANNNISLEIPIKSIIPIIENEIEKSLSVSNMSRMFNITIQ